MNISLVLDANDAERHSHARMRCEGKYNEVGGDGDMVRMVEAMRDYIGYKDSYIPSVLVTTGRLLLESLGEDILELWGDVRAVVVAAAILWGGDVGSEIKDDRRGELGPKLSTPAPSSTRTQLFHCAHTPRLGKVSLLLSITVSSVYFASP